MRYLEHVVDDVEFDDGLASDQVVHHGVVQVMRHGEGQQQDQGLQDVAHMRWLQQPRPTEHTRTERAGREVGKNAQSSRSLAPNEGACVQEHFDSQPRCPLFSSDWEVLDFICCCMFTSI